MQLITNCLFDNSDCHLIEVIRGFVIKEGQQRTHNSVVTLHGLNQLNQYWW